MIRSILHATALILMLSIAAGFGLAVWLYAQPQQADSSVRTPQTRCHGVWLGHTWMEDPHSDAEIDSLAAELRDHQIGCVYVHTTPLTEQGGLDLTRMDEAAGFIKRFQTQAPEITLYAWMGMVNAEHNNPNTIGPDVELTDHLWMREAKRTALELVDTWGFDGIQIDLEPLRSGDQAFLTFLAGLHEALSVRQKPLSVAAMFNREPSDVLTADERSQLPSQDNRYLWSWLAEYYSDVAIYSDQVVVMAYNKGITEEADYTEFIRQQLERIAPRVALEADLILGVPSYEPFAGESLRAATEGLFAYERSTSLVAGMAIYAYWTTDEDEWADWDLALDRLAKE